MSLATAPIKNNTPVCGPTPARRGRRACWDGRPCGGHRRSLRTSKRWCSCGFGPSANRFGGRCGRQRSGCAAQPKPLRRRKDNDGRGCAPGPRSPGDGLSAGVQRRIFERRLETADYDTVGCATRLGPAEGLLLNGG